MTSKVKYKTRIESVRLELTGDEAKALYLMLGRVYGSHPLRDQLSDVWNKLRDLGFRCSKDRDLSTGNVDAKFMFQKDGLDKVDFIPEQELI
jgi:hypothetical protein